MDHTDGDGVEEVELRATDPAGDDETVRLQHGQVLGDAEAGHLGHGGRQLAERLAVPLVQQVEQRPAVTVGQGPEHGVEPIGVRSGHYVTI